MLSYVYSEIEISKRIVGVNMIKWEAMIDYLRAIWGQNISSKEVKIQLGVDRMKIQSPNIINYVSDQTWRLHFSCKNVTQKIMNEQPRGAYV